jgi:hypothetical protein
VTACTCGCCTRKDSSSTLDKGGRGKWEAESSAGKESLRLVQTKLRASTGLITVWWRSKWGSEREHRVRRVTDPPTTRARQKRCCFPWYPCSSLNPAAGARPAGEPCAVARARTRCGVAGTNQVRWVCWYSNRLQPTVSIYSEGGCGLPQPLGGEKMPFNGQQHPYPF